MAEPAPLHAAELLAEQVRRQWAWQGWRADVWVEAVPQPRGAPLFEVRAGWLVSMANPRRRMRLRADWPPGSNALLLMHQKRTEFGYSAAVATTDGPRIFALSPQSPASREKEGVSV